MRDSLPTTVTNQESGIVNMDSDYSFGIHG